MPELGILPSSNLPVLVFQPQPPPFDNRTAPRPPVDMSKAYAAKAKADMYSSIAEALAKLPEQLMDAYQKGKQMRTAGMVRKSFEEAFAKRGTPEGDAALMNFGATSQGGVTYNPQNAEYNRLRLEDLRSRTNENAKARKPLFDLPFTPTPRNQPAAVAPPAQEAPLRVPMGLRATPPSIEGPLPAPAEQSTTLDWTDVPPAPPLSQIVPLDTREAIQRNAENAAGQLSNLPLSQLTAQNAPGPITPANIKPIEPEVRTPVGGVGINTETGVRVMVRNGRVIEEYPNGTIREYALPEEEAAKQSKGIVYPNLEALQADAKARGFDPSGAKFMPDGSFLLEEFTPIGTDVKGKSTLTDSQKNRLGGALAMTKDFTDLSDMHARLYKEGKAGLQGGTAVEYIKKFLGAGSADFVTSSGKLDISKFKITRALNGAGVLTDRDFARAQAAVPSLRENPEQFNAKLKTVQDYLAEDLENWIAINADKASAEQMFVADEALKVLRGQASSISSPATSSALPSPVASELEKYKEALRQRPDHPRAAEIRAAIKAMESAASRE